MRFFTFFLSLILFCVYFKCAESLYPSILCDVTFYPAATSAAYGNIGYVGVTFASNLQTDCYGTTTVAFLLAKGTTTCNGGSVDTGNLYSEQGLWAMYETLVNALVIKQFVFITLNSGNACQIDYIQVPREI